MKPLNVRVAEALGDEPRLTYEVVNEEGTSSFIGFDTRREAENWMAGNRARFPRGIVVSERARVDVWKHYQHYDTDWSATGPLIEQYGISLNYFVCVSECCPPDGVRWTAAYGSLGLEYPDAKYEASAPLIAVCNLILALHASGKLSASPAKETIPENPQKAR